MSDCRTPQSVSSDSGDAWFVVWTEARAEKQVESRIARKGIESWLPTMRERRRWSDRWKDVVLPLFPGYLFARGGQHELPRVLQTPGVMTVVKNAGRPATLSCEFIERLRNAIETQGAAPAPLEEQVSYAVDDEVVVQEGPLQGLRGVVQEVRGRRRLVLWIDGIGRAVGFNIDSALVAPARARMSP
jgi:transcription antitermination factor NusG